ncbi:MAG: 4-hydroxythreonine-4-phosphate dehydrogenase PdxA [Bergeyella sp.]|nr:4-hydroxythreonine-4-phosphate dehydrogenase PdxA [Bergeyella sp.]
MNSRQPPIKVGISVGDFNGIGPEVIMKTLLDKNITDFFTPVIFGSGNLFNYQKSIFKLNVNFHCIEKISQIQHKKINVINLWKDPVEVRLGFATEISAKMALESLEAATGALLNKETDILVTAPIQKDEMMKLGFPFIGHTEYLEDKFQKKGLMLLVSEDLKTAVATHHIPVSEISGKLSKASIISQVKILQESLIQDFCIQKPKLAVLGLNPHAGDNGRIGKEEQDTIIPAIEELQKEGILAFGPYPADSFFQPNKYSSFDAVLAMYHDQGLIPFKTLAYEEGVNFTAGLPFVRTSPDHGVAYDIAGKNIADPRSFMEAIFTGIRIYKNREEYNALKKTQLKKTSEDQGMDEDLL